MEWVKVPVEGTQWYYWTWRDLPFLPYAWLGKKELKTLPQPFYLDEIHPDCPTGWETTEEDEYTNIIPLHENSLSRKSRSSERIFGSKNPLINKEQNGGFLLPKRFEDLTMDPDLRKDLRRIEKKNSDVVLVLNEKNALKKSQRWFLELWKEEKEDFARRLSLWKKKCYTLSAYAGKELLGVHIAMKDEKKKTVYYFGCWWNRDHRSRSLPTFLLKKDIERAITEKMKYYDLEVGDEPYKRQWGVIRKPTKYYAILSKEMAEYLGIPKYILLGKKFK